MRVEMPFASRRCDRLSRRSRVPSVEPPSTNMYSEGSSSCASTESTHLSMRLMEFQHIVMTVDFIVHGLYKELLERSETALADDLFCDADDLQSLLELDGIWDAVEDVGGDVLPHVGA